MSTSEGRGERLARLESLVERLQTAQKRLEQAGSPEEAVELLSELASLAREVHVEIDQARRGSEDDASG